MVGGIRALRARVSKTEADTAQPGRGRRVEGHERREARRGRREAVGHGRTRDFHSRGRRVCRLERRHTGRALLKRVTSRPPGPATSSRMDQGASEPSSVTMEGATAKRVSRPSWCREWNLSPVPHACAVSLHDRFVSAGAATDSLVPWSTVSQLSSLPCLSSTMAAAIRGIVAAQLRDHSA